MLKVQKKQGKITQAYRLKEGHPFIENLMKENQIKKVNDNEYEVFSQEAVLTESGRGQLACSDDWIRIDNAGFPYPCTNEWFQQNLRHIEGDDYEQIPKVLSAWNADQPVCKEIEFLKTEKGLILDDANPDKYFQAILWGNPEAAPKDAFLIFYDITYDSDGNITDADYNFVQKNEFEKTYDILD